jgi:hypothetical protein
LSYTLTYISLSDDGVELTYKMRDSVMIFEFFHFFFLFLHTLVKPLVY